MDLSLYLVISDRFIVLSFLCCEELGYNILAKYPSVKGHLWHLGCSEFTGWWCPLYVAVGTVIPLIFVYKKSFEINNK